MKKIIQLITICLVITSCDFQKVTDLQDDFEIKVTAEPVLSRVDIKVFNSKDGSDISENINLSFSGQDADKIYTVNGNKNFKIENGFISLGINRNTVVTNENPLSITATISANGYITKSQEINFDGGDMQEVQMSMMKLSDLPESTSLKSVTETLVNNKTTKEIKIEIPSKSDSNEIIEVSIPADTEFYDENGNTITGSDVKIDFQTFDTTIPTVDELSNSVTNPETLAGGYNEFPGSLEIQDASKTSNTNNLASKYLVPIGSLYCIYYYVNGRRVYGVSRPTTFYFIIRKNRINPNTGQNVKAGDLIAFYRKVGNRNSKIGDVVVKNWSSNYLYFRKTIPAGPGIYPYGFEVTPSCNTVPNKITFQNDNKRTFYFYNIANKTNPNRALRWGYMYFDGKYEVNSRNVRYWRNRAIGMLKDNMILKIYYYSWQERRFKVIYNKEVSTCDLDGQTIDITNPDCYQQRALDLRLKCPDATYFLNYSSIYYKKESDRYWSYFDRVINSKLNGKSPCLEAGVKYQFGFWYNGWKKTPPLTEQEMLKLYENFDLDAICKAIKDL